MENLCTLKEEILSEKGTYRAQIAKISNILIITISSVGKSDLKYLEADYATIQTFRVRDSRSSITGNNGSAGQLTMKIIELKLLEQTKIKV